MRCATLGITVLLALGAAPLLGHAVDIREVHIADRPQGTRVTLDLSAGAPHRLISEHHPERLVLEVSGAHVRKGLAASLAGAGDVHQVRLSSGAKNARITLDLIQAAHAHAYLAKPSGHLGYRLIVDLSPPAQPAAAPSTVVAAADRPVRAAHARPDGRDLVIAVDAGHGGEDPGAVGKGGTHEKDVVLAIARELAGRISAEPGMHAVLTRDGDYFVPLRDRMRRARAKQADLFVSVHADSIADRSIDGSSVYILSQHGATSEAARWLADRENAADLIGGVSLDDKNDLLASVLLDVSQSVAMSASQVAADRVLRSLSQAGQIRKPLVQQAGFMVLKSPDIPSMLVETAYISNPTEEARLRTPAQQARIAGAIQRGLHDYFYANPPAGTRVAQVAGGGGNTRELVATAAAGGAGN